MSRPDPVRVSREALFRYRIVSAVLCLEAQGARRGEAVRQVAEAEYTDDLGPRSVSRRTVYRWLKAHALDGLAGPEPAGRETIEGSTVLPPAFLTFLREERARDPDASIPELIRRGRAYGHLPPESEVCRQTV